MQLMTQAEYARHCGVGKPAVSNWKKAGLLVLVEDGDGKIRVDRDRSDARRNAKVDPMRGRPSTGQIAPTGEASAEGLPLNDSPPAPQSAPASAGAPDFNAERTAELIERRIGAALKNAQLAGNLVPLVEAERRVSEAGRVARERVQSQFRGLAERLAATTDLRAVMLLCEEAIDAVFAELAAAAARGDLAGEDDDLTPEESAEIEAAAVELVE